jgi:hypothetical protein
MLSSGEVQHPKVQGRQLRNPKYPPKMRSQQQQSLGHLKRQQAQPLM